MRKIELKVQGMTCEHCAVRVKQALTAVPNVQEVQVPGWQSGRVLATTEGAVEEEVLVEAVEKAGYKASLERSPATLRQTASEPAMHQKAAERVDLLVIGGGSAGFAAAIRGADLRRGVVLVENNVVGGTCVNVGCVPSKTLLSAMERYEQAAANPFAGLSTSAGRLQWGQLIQQKDTLVRQMRQEKYLDVLAQYPSVKLVHGKARFEDEETIEVDGALYRPASVIIATGARPAIPPIPGLEQTSFLDSTAALALRERPASLIVLGGGAIGVELGQLFARAGSTVTILEMMPTLLPMEEPALGEALAEKLRAQEGIRIESGTQVKRVESARGGVRVQFEREGRHESVEGEVLLVSAGRRPNTERLNLPAAGIEVDGQGAIQVTDYLQTTCPHIFAAGDVTGLPQYVYVAAAAGAIAASNALEGKTTPLDLTAVPRVTFTDPPLAAVGLTEAEARQAGHAPITTELPLTFVPRALANHDTRGLIKVVADDASRRLLGVHILAPQAGEMIQPAVLALKFGLTIDQLTDTFFPYLTMSEGLKLALISFDKEVAALSCCAF